jgi:hypothetical protein
MVNTLEVAPHYEGEDAPTVEHAVRDWNKGLDFLFEFAVKAFYIVGKRDGGTERLAKKIKREVDTVERYAAAGCLWLDLLATYPADSETLRDCVDVSFWAAIGAKYKAGLISLEQAKSFLEESYEKKLTVERVRSMLPNSKVGDSPFKKATRQIYNILEKQILDAPALESGMNEKEYRQFIKMAKWLKTFLEKFTK